ncbi:MAG: PBSX family phage terminase large subunit [Provencibacterium sp.]|jgi:PBSX family phage terminase large subunit|nr:PBSX family phage terminase large subunit [Provencibacterium sp.]
MPISEKQKSILAFPYSQYDALICDGAVRSGKTSIEVVAFIDWAMREFSGQRFGICGKTVGSATENMVIPYISRSYAKRRYTLHWRRSQKILEVRRGRRVNYFEVFGGRDESSFTLIQGRTLAGVLLDEVVLMPESFVNQALARCSVEGARIWFSCNPGNPSHWFKEEWIDKREEHNALYLHFEMTDNPSLSKKTLARYQSMYHGVFYDRYVRGLWVPAEGLIYPMFTDDRIAPDAERQYRKYMISMDYGTRNPTAMVLWGLCDGVWYGFKEYYFNSRTEMAQKTDQEYYDDLCKFAGDLPIDHIIIDPSALSFITLAEKNHCFKVWDADNDVLDGIRHTAQCISDGTIRICAACENTIKEFGLYSWDEDATEDRPIKGNDHAMDAVRYFVQTTGVWNKKSGRTLF